MPISFNSVPDSLRLPLVWMEVDPSQAGTFANYQRGLIFGYKNSAAPGVANVAERVTSPDFAKVRAGRGSQAALMAAAWFKNNAFDELWYVPITEPGAGTAATGTIVVSGPATASGIVTLYIGGQKIPVKVLTGDTANAIATAIGAALNAALDLPVAASVATSTVTLTARWKGVCGNDIDIRHSYLGSLGGEALPAGVTLVITAMAAAPACPT